MLDWFRQKQEDRVMTIEIADRLVKLRKKYGYSQEELADKLGLSRQAVSKWERAEASPDTDNLICLAKLYGVSLDELLATDEDIDTIVEEQVKGDKKEEPKEENQDDHAEIKDDHIVLFAKDGKKVTIDHDGITCYNKDGTVKRKNFDVPNAVIGAIEATLFTMAVIAYIILGAVCNLWYNAWVVFFLPEIVCSFMRAVRRGNAQHFNIAFVSLFAFFFVCMCIPGLDAHLWHPMWVVFLAIPLYHTTVGAINKAIGKPDKDEDDDDDDKHSVKVKADIDIK